MKYSVVVLTILYFGVFSSQLNAQLLPENLHFQKIETDEKLTGQIITRIVQDDQGFIWAGTINGLHRYDGQHVKSYASDAKDRYSISNNYISDICTSKKGGLWITTQKGLNYYDPATDRFQCWGHNDNDSTSIPYNKLHRVIEDQSGKVWMSSFSQGLLRFDPETQVFTDWPINIGSVIGGGYEAILEDSKGRIWFGGAAMGIIIYDPKLERFVEQDPAFSALKPFKEQRIEQFIEDKSGNIWFCNNKLYSFNLFNGELTEHTAVNDYDFYGISSLMQDSQERIWLGTNTGLLLYHPVLNTVQQWQHDQTKSWSISSNQLYKSILEDQQGLIWIGTYNGLNVVDPLSFAFEHLILPKTKGIPNTPEVYAIATDQQKRLWLGTSKGICQYAPKNRKYSPAPSAFNQKSREAPTNDIHCDTEGQIWISQERTLIQYKPNNDIHYWDKSSQDRNGQSLQMMYGFDIQSDDKHNIWVGTWSKGLIKLDLSNNTITNYKWTQGMDYLADTIPHSTTIQQLAFNPEGKIWAATYTGLYLLDTQNQTVKYYRHDPKDPSSFCAEEPLSLFIDSQQRTWIGTRTGISLYQPSTDSFKHFKKEQGLNVSVFEFEEDSKGNLWLGTSNGLFIFNPTTLKSRQFHPEDGVAKGAIYASAKDTDGYLYFSGEAGAIRFHPDHVQENSYKPKTIITELLLFNELVNDSTVLPKSISTIEEITLTHDQYIFGFKFSALNLRQPYRNQYQYKLKGFNENWISTTAQNAQATFTNLDAGTYTFMVKASNDNGYWNDTPTTLNIIVLPPWYLTWWAKTIWFFLAFGSLFTFYIWRVNTLKRQKRLLETQVEERTLEIVNQKEEIIQQAEELKTSNEQLLSLNQFKEDMGNMIVHDFKAPLNSILWYGKENEKVYASGQRLQHLLENFLDVYRFEHAKLAVDSKTVSLHQIISKALQQSEALRLAKSIQILNLVHTNLYVIADEELILRVLVNLLTNAIKYSPTQARITMDATILDEQQIRFSISDTGQGIPKEKLAYLFDKYSQVDLRKSGNIRSTGLGLTFCKLAIEAHHGEIWAESEQQVGSTFYFTLQKAIEIPPQPYLPNIPEKEAEFNFNEVERTQLLQHIVQLEQLETYQLAEVKKVIADIDNMQGDHIKNWKSEVLRACFAANQERFEELLQLTK